MNISRLKFWKKDTLPVLNDRVMSFEKDKLLKLSPSSKIYLYKSIIKGAGRGVFPVKILEKGELIERCPVLVIEKDEVPRLRQIILRNYYFMEGEDEESHRAAICLGFGSIYNHSYRPNATYEKHISEGYIDFIALKTIQKDEEITVNYNHGDPNDKSKLWIDSIPGFKENNV